MIFFNNFVSGCTSVSPADVIFLIDESASVTLPYFKDTMAALSTTVDNLAIGEHDIRVAFVLFEGASTARNLTDLNFSYDKNVIKGVLSSAVYANGNDTDIASVLNYTCRTMCVANKGDRSSAQNYVIILSDGITDATQAKYAGNLCKNDGVLIITVGIGATTSGYNVLRDLASIYPDYYLNTTYAELGTTLPDLVTTLINCSSSGKQYCIVMVIDLNFE